MAMEDITDKKNADDALRRSEALYQELFEVSPGAMFESDWSHLKLMVDDSRSDGVVGFVEYFAMHAEFLDCAAAGCESVYINATVLEMYGADNKDELLETMNTMLRHSSF